MCVWVGEKRRVYVLSMFDSFGLWRCRRQRMKTERERGKQQAKVNEVIKTLL